jgi:hypothetical protein
MTPTEAWEIRRSTEDAETLADRYGCTEKLVRSIKRGEAFAHIDVTVDGRGYDPTDYAAIASDEELVKARRWRFA